MRRTAPPSFEAMYDDQCDRIYRFCYRLCGSAADAEDLTQETFLLAYRAWGTFQGRASAATWLYRIAVRRWSRLQRGMPETVPTDHEDHQRIPCAPDPARTGLDRISLECALASLTEPQRQAFLLVKAEGLKCREAAEVLGIPEGTLKSRVHDAVVRLRALLAEPDPAHAARAGASSKGTVR